MNPCKLLLTSLLVLTTAAAEARASDGMWDGRARGAWLLGRVEGTLFDQVGEPVFELSADAVYYTLPVQDYCSNVIGGELRGHLYGRNGSRLRVSGGFHGERGRLATFQALVFLDRSPVVVGALRGVFREGSRCPGHGSRPFQRLRRVVPAPPLTDALVAEATGEAPPPTASPISEGTFAARWIVRK